MERKLIDAGVRNLKKSRYLAVNSKNVLTDAEGKVFFARMLEEIKEDAKRNPGVIVVCDSFPV